MSGIAGLRDVGPAPKLERAPSPLRSSPKEKVRSVIVAHGSLSIIRILDQSRLSDTAGETSKFFIPRTITTIVSSCFYGWKGMTAVCFEADSLLEEISDQAFAGTSLRTFFLAKRVDKLGASCFSECDFLWLVSFEVADSSHSLSISFRPEAFRKSGLVWIEFPAHIDHIGEYCFHECPSLFVIQSANPLSSMDLDRQILSSSGIEIFRIPEAESKIDPHPGLPSSTFNSSSLSEFVIDSAFTSIRDSCFRHCAHLHDISFQPDSRVRKIEPRAFSGCGFHSIVIPQSVEFIGLYSFAECPRLTGLSFEPKSRLRIICDFAFKSVSLTSICLPASVSSINGSALTMISLVTLRDDGFDPCLSVDSSFLYDVTGKKVIRYFGSSTEVAIPSTVEQIGESSFCDARVEHVRIPKSVKVLETYSFSRCAELIRVEIESDSVLRRIESFAFAYSSLKSIVLPKSVEIVSGTAFLNVLDVSFQSDKWMQFRDEAIWNSDGSIIFPHFRDRQRL
jgi:hypothetical protein